MPIPLKWSSGLTISGSDWNDARLYAPADYVVFKEGSTYYAYAQHSGSSDYSGSSAHTVINNALAGVPTGSCVRLLKGEYTITSPIILRTGSALIGSGRGTVLKAGANDIYVIKASGSYGHEVLVANLTIDGNKGTYSNVSGVYLCYVTGSKVTNCWIKNCSGSGIYSSHSNNIITNNYIEKNNQDGIWLYVDTKTIVGNNICHSNGRRGIHVNLGSKNVITSNVCSENTTQGIFLNSQYECIVNGNNVTLNQYEGIKITGNFNSIVGNVLYSNSQDTNNGYCEIVVTGSSMYNAIIGNVIKCAETNKASYGIRDYSNDSYNLVIGNIVSGSATDTILLEGTNSLSGSNVNIA